MNVAARLNDRITQLAVGRHLPHRAARVRLTLLYGGLFLASGAALMAIAYALLVNAGFVFTIQNGPAGGQPLTLVAGSASPGGVLAPGARTHPSAQTIAHWRTVAQCIRRRGISRFPDPSTSVPSDLAPFGEISDRDGAIFAIPATIDRQAPRFARAATACGLYADRTKATAADDRRRGQEQEDLLIQSGLALAAMSLISLAVGWLMAGRVLQPLEDSYRAQRRFVANASHELRAPLTRLRALSEVALAGSEPSVASLTTAHERVLAAEQHLEQLIDGLLALTRGEAGLERREHLDLAPLTSHALLAHDAQLADRDLDVRATLDPAPTAGDPRLLERLIANLIDNAIRHNNPGGQIELTTGTRDRRAFLTVANTGPTVPSGEIQRLFVPFQRLDGARTHHDDGHGLGLSIVQAIANAHGAELITRARPEGGLVIEVSFSSAASSARPRLGGAELDRRRDWTRPPRFGRLWETRRDPTREQTRWPP